MLTALVFILVLGLLIFVHELGHFLAARATGMQVEEFAFGFPPRLLSKKIHGTLYALNLIPLGGYVRILGEDSNSKLAGSFSRKSWHVRLGVVAAGVVMNFVLAVVLMTMGFSIGMVPPASDPMQLGGTKMPFIIISDVIKDSSAASARLKAGDQLIAGKDGTKTVAIFQNGADVTAFSQTHQNQKVSFVVHQNGRRVNTTLPLTLGAGATPLGIAFADSAIVKLPLKAAIRQSAIETGAVIKALTLFLGDTIMGLFKGRVPSEISGPVGIYQFTGQAVALGVSFVIQLAAILSINLGMINFLPLPALDGGRALFLLVEGMAGKRAVHERVEAIVHTIGFYLLILLLLLLTGRDILRLH